MRYAIPDLSEEDYTFVKDFMFSKTVGDKTYTEEYALPSGKLFKINYTTVTYRNFVVEDDKKMGEQGEKI